MSKKAGSSPSANPKSANASMFRAPFAPRPGLFYALLGLLGIWVAVLLTMYFTTVHAQRDAHVVPAEPAETLPSTVR